MAAGFVHLHVHSDYSLLDGMCRVDRLVEKTAPRGMAAVALTDHASLAGVPQFCRLALQRRIQPIVGCELALRGSSEAAGGADDGPGYHLVLLARNETGYRNLCRLVALAWLGGEREPVPLDLATMARHADGLLALSGCERGEVPTLLRRGRSDAAADAARRLAALFSPGDFFLEIQPWRAGEPPDPAEGMRTLAGVTGLPLVATNNVHFLEADDALAHEVWRCLRAGKRLADPDRPPADGREAEFKSPAEMAKQFEHWPNALANTLAIAERCRCTPDFTRSHGPVFPAPAGATPESYLEQLCREELDRWLRLPAGTGPAGRPHTSPEAYRNRLEEELRLIFPKGLASAFLLARDLAREARRRGIPTGPGRGAATASLACFLLGITRIDPLRYGLLFERFLNPDHTGPPMFDLDVSPRRRGELVAYLRERWGAARLCDRLVEPRWNRMGSLAGEVGRVLGLPLELQEQLALLFSPEGDWDPEKRKERLEALARLVLEDPRAAEWLGISRRLDGLVRHLVVHTAAVLVAPSELTENIPVQASSTGEPVAQYSARELQKLGFQVLFLMDLGILAVMGDCLDSIGRGYGVILDPDDFPEDDPATLKLLASGETVGVFLFERQVTRYFLQALRPDSLEDLAALYALDRPGPVNMGLVDEFIAKKHQTEPIQYLAPELAPVLAPTHRLLIYQEQVMEIAMRLGGLPAEEADRYRRALGRGQAEPLGRFNRRLIQGLVSGGVAPFVAKQLVELFGFFKPLFFHKAHAVAYARLAYQTAYLKAHYPREYMTALVFQHLGEPERLNRLLAECEKLGVPVPSLAQ